MNLQNLSIKGKLMLITMLTSSAALVLSSASFLIYDLISFRHLLTLDLMTQAQIIGYNSAAAMAFRDEAAATATLSALTAKEDIVAAVLYSPDGTIFAHYFPNGTAHPSALPGRSQENGYRFEAGYLEVFRDVTLNGERVGTLFLQSDQRQRTLRARRYSAIVGIFVVSSGLFGLLCSSECPTWLSCPILNF